MVLINSLIPKDKYFYIIFPLLFVLVSVVWILINGSFMFEYEFINKVGDQQLYHSIAYKLAHFSGEKNYYTLGYPFFYLPFVLLTGVQASWESIMPLVIPTQSFVLMPLAIYLIFRNKTRYHAVVVLALLSIYYFRWLLVSQDFLIKYTFFGLIPLSESLSILLLILTYDVYLKYFRNKNPKTKHFIWLSLLIAWGALTRNVVLILVMPLFIDLLWDKKFKYFIKLGLISGLLYSPQLLYNYLISGDPMFNGYVWKSQQREAKNMKLIEALYGIKSSALFSMKYMEINLRKLVMQYSPTVAMGVFVPITKKHRLVILVAIFSLINVVFFSTYWWSITGGLMDRFLMPNVFLLFYVYQNRLIKQSEIN